MFIAQRTVNSQRSRPKQSPGDRRYAAESIPVQNQQSAEPLEDNGCENKTRDRAGTPQKEKGHKRAKNANKHQKLRRAGALELQEFWKAVMS